MPVRIEGAAGLAAYANQPIGSTDWEPMTFERIQAFADATGDHQWIHVDRERIAKESPFGAPIAHGYLTLSLVAGRFFELLELDGFAMVINYGTGKVRFPNPLRRATVPADHPARRGHREAAAGTRHLPRRRRGGGRGCPPARPVHLPLPPGLWARTAPSGGP